MTKIIQYKTLIIGSSSFIGRHLSSLYKENLILTYYKNRIKNGIQFDISKDNISIILEKNNVKQVILIGGVVNFNEIKKNYQYAKSINVNNMTRIINDIISYGAKVIYFSSESVFDGKIGNYKETYKPLPKFIYGEQKYQVEEHIKLKTNNYLIFRISKVFSSNPIDNTMITNWLKQLLNNETILIAQDNILTPIHVNDCVSIIIKLIKNEEKGIFNICSTDKFSRLEMFDIILTEYKKYNTFTGKVKLVALNDIVGAEQLPVNTSLNYHKTYKATGIQPLKFKKISKEIIKNFITKNSKFKSE